MKLPNSGTQSFRIDKIPHFFREMWVIIKKNAGSLAAFVFLYAVVNAIITPVAIRGILILALRLNGTTYLGPDNMYGILLSPFTILLTIPALLVIVFPPIFEVSGILHAMSMSKIGKKTSLSGMIDAGLFACKRSFAPKNWLIILFFAVLIPLSGVMSFSSGTLTLALPEFIRDFLTADGLYNVLYKILHLILLFLLLSYIFMLGFYSLEEKNFINACRESNKLIKGKKISTLLWLLAASATFFVISVSVSAVISQISIYVANLFMKSSGGITDASRIMSINNAIRGVFVGIISPVINLAAVTVLFYEYTEENNNLVKVSKRAFNDTKLPVYKIVILAVVVTAFAGLGLATNDYSIITSNVTNKTEIVAHRGDSVRAPENTMSAFKLATLEDPDWIELDVHETKDGVIIVSHDDDLTRVARQKLFVHELTYEETQKLDVGSWFSPEFKGEHLSRLDEVLEFFKDFDFGIQIEIKPTGFDKDLEEKVLEIIDESGIKDRCVITSLNLDTLLRVEELDPSAVTVYSMFVAWEHIETIPVDFYTIEESNVNQKLVQNIHNAGKKVFAWTANTEDTIQYLYDCGVDGILTDDPIMLKNALSRIHTNNGFLRSLRLGTDRIVQGR